MDYFKTNASINRGYKGEKSFLELCYILENAIYLNKEIMNQFREKMKPFYYDPTKYNTYLEQLGITYPTLEKK